MVLFIIFIIIIIIIFTPKIKYSYKQVWYNQIK